jgi:hypothetical protein
MEMAREMGMVRETEIAREIYAEIVDTEIAEGRWGYRD